MSTSSPASDEPPKIRNMQLAECLITQLLTGKSIQESASLAGIAYSTARRWMRNERFQKMYTQARREALQTAVGHLSAVAAQAVSTLQKNLSCGQANVETQSANAILGHVTKAEALLNIDERLAELERKAKKRQGQR